MARFISTIGGRGATQAAVLIATDGDLGRRLALRLQDVGFRTRYATSERLVAAVTAELPDAVIVEGPQSAAMCAALNDARSPRLPVIALVDDPALRLAALRAGADLCTTAIEEVLAGIPWLIEASRRDRAMTAQVDTVRLWHDWVRYLVHDLRNALTAATAYLSLAALHGVPRTVAHDLARVKQAHDDLTAMLQDILDTDRIKHGALALEKTEFDLVEVAREAANKISARHAVEVAADGDTRILADPVLLRRVLANLLTNATRYVLERPIRVEVTGGAHGVSATVSNDGPGISAELLPHLFEPWHAVEGGRPTGIGLAFCRLVCEAHDGQIWLDNAEAGAVTFAFGIRGQGRTIRPGNRGVASGIGHGNRAQVL